MNSAALLLRYLAISLRGQLQYRASFLMAALGNLLNCLIELAGIWVLFDRFGTLSGWSFAEVALFCGAINATSTLAGGSIKPNAKLYPDATSIRSPALRPGATSRT